ncbi:MAG: PrsW family glutamic-type intramembrane protease [Candidatus Sumerlaeia bacterium]|nr:PrsW family glutamic-type intramembrane protease [Candidatus Sumerlaeia bacterium]
MAAEAGLHLAALGLLGVWLLSLEAAAARAGLPRRWAVGALAWGLFGAAPLAAAAARSKLDSLGLAQGGGVREAVAVLLVAPLAEEALKLAVVVAAQFAGGAASARRRFVLGAMAGVGFGAAELAWFATQSLFAGAGGGAQAFERALCVVPMHALATGAGASLAGPRAGARLAGALAAAAALHWLWNAAAWSGFAAAGTVARGAVAVSAAAAAVWLARGPRRPDG